MSQQSKELEPQKPIEVPEVFNTGKVVRQLENLMDKVTATEATPETVNAACNCAARITDILRIHLDVQRLYRSGRVR